MVAEVAMKAVIIPVTVAVTELSEGKESTMRKLCQSAEESSRCILGSILGLISVSIIGEIAWCGCLRATRAQHDVGKGSLELS